MINKFSYVKYVHTDRNITTVEQLLKSDLFTNNRISKAEFLSFKATGFIDLDDGLGENIAEAGTYPSNLEMIWSKYDGVEQFNNRGLYVSNNLSILKQGTPLYIPLSSYNKEVLPIRNKNFLKQDQDIPAFFSQKQLELEGNPDYVKAQRLTSKGREVNVQMIEQNCQVWVYSKTLDKIIDVSPFISNLNTSKSDIGSFSFTLEPIHVILDRVSKSETYDFLSIFGTDYVNEFILFKDGKLNISFFEKYFQQNDAVFIRFEKLKLEQDNVSRTGLEINKSCLKDQIFDMMGLVDNVSSSINFQNTSYVISINGRDFTKALVEDGQYLIDLIYVQGEQNRFFYGGNPGDKFFKRNYVDEGSYQYLFTKSERKNIYDSLAFIINQMSNIGWTPNELFSDYGSDKRVQSYRVSGIEDMEDYLTTKEVNGIWQIIKLNVDKKISDRRILNDTMFDMDGTLIEYFKNICQEPFVEFWGDTYGAGFEFIVRQPPTDAAGMRDIVSKKQYIEIEPEDTYNINLAWESEYYSWFQFMPTGMDYDNNAFFWGFHFPIIYLEKYVEHFGNHRKVVNDKYVPESSWGGAKSKQDTNITAEALFNDLKYALEHYSVLPFTRRGTVVINGDRRIKRGSFILLKATNEICKVDSVSHNLSFNSTSINRTTVLGVSRCMIIDFVKGFPLGKGSTISGAVAVNGAYLIEDMYQPYFSYFDIVKSKIITKDLYNRQSTNQGFTVVDKQTKTDFTIEEEIFEFFLKREQMDGVQAVYRERI